MGQRKNLCVSLGSGPYVACFNTPLHHLSHPTLQEKVDTSAPLSALCLNSPFQCCSWTLFVFSSSPSSIYISYFGANQFPDTRSKPSAEELCIRVTTNEQTQLCELCFISFLLLFSSSLSTEHHFLLTFISPSLSAQRWASIMLSVCWPAVIQPKELSAVHS